MEYRSVAQMAEQWGISDRRVRILCQQGKIDGVIRKGRAWLIPSERRFLIFLIKTYWSCG